MLIQDSARMVAFGRKVLEDRIFTAAEIGKHKSETDAWIVVDGCVYDITKFLETHPGGAETILKNLHQKDAGKLMSGEQFSNAHSHSKHAFRMLQQFVIGRSDCQRLEENLKVHSEADTQNHEVDLTKPLVFQVGRLGAAYNKWVHNPIVQKEPPRFFESDIAEFFTQTKWWVIPVVWLPVAIFLSILAHNQGLSPCVTPFTLVGGAYVWTFIEYCLHRYIFHMTTSSYWTNTLHYFFHGFHHKHPMDGSRLVFPPAITAILVTIIYFLLEPLVLVVGRPAKLSIFSGGLLMYIAYDLTHYFLHFGTAFNESSCLMKRFHLDHHFKDPSNSYGITTIFWDGAFATQPSQSINRAD